MKQPEITDDWESTLSRREIYFIEESFLQRSTFFAVQQKAKETKLQTVRAQSPRKSKVLPENC